MLTPEKLQEIARQFILQTLVEAEAGYWLRRAEDFARVGTPACDEIAQACRNKATLCALEGAGDWAELLRVELGDAA